MEAEHSTGTPPIDMPPILPPNSDTKKIDLPTVAFDSSNLELHDSFAHIQGQTSENHTPVQENSVTTPSPQIVQSGGYRVYQLHDLIADRYKIEKIIGQGGMGAIYLAMDMKLERPVAIKMMLSPDEINDNKRFQLESKTVASFSDPHTVRLFDYGITAEGYQYQVMEYLQGKNIDQFIKAHGPIPPSLAKKITIQVCGSLAEAHRKQIIHRDIKPSNIMLIETPEHGIQSKLLDFGLVRTENHDPTLTKTNTVLGSPMYMSPEQIDSQTSPINMKTDIYSLGLTIYTMITGKPPFAASNLSGILAAQLFQQPPAILDLQPQLGTEPALCWIVQTAIKKECDQRFASIQQMKQALELSVVQPNVVFELRQEQLFANGQLIESTQMSGYDSFASLQQSSSDIGVETLKQKTPVFVATNAPKNNMLYVYVAVAIVIIAIGVGTLFPQQPVPIPTNIENTSPPVEQTITIQIDSVPSGASILSNGNKIGTTPYVLELSSNENKSISLEKQGYESKIVIVDTTESVVQVQLEPLLTATPVENVQPTENKKTPKKTTTTPENTSRPKKTTGVKKVSDPFAQ